MSLPDAVLDAPGVATVLESSADPHTARAALTRVLEAHPELAGELRDDRLVRDALIAIACASRSLTAALVADPTLVEPMRDPTAFNAERTVAGYHGSVDASAIDDADTLREWKRREYLRIAARDLLGVADLPTVGRELAALAEVCLDRALLLSEPDVPLTVIAMGKLGGQELNYSSDVDVLFVHAGDDQVEADNAARRLLAVMAEPTPAGIVFRTDAELRPEGRSGPLTRSLDSYRVWYERWARTWEFQALIKARPVAGDPTLGPKFMELVEPFVWPEVLGPDAVRAVRAMKARAEGETRRRGLDDRELKRGRGGIRDIEFAVQLLQLVHGRHDLSIRSGNTLDALAQLVTAGYVDPRDAVPFDLAYRFLRTVEHRLQLWDEQQTHTLPTDPVALTRLARVLGYRDQGSSSAAARLDAEHRMHQGRVRSTHEKLFFGPLLEALSGRPGLKVDAAEERLRAFGFLDLRATRAALDELTRGFSRTSRLMEQLLPLLLEWCSESPDPDLALLQLRRLAEGPARSANLAIVFRDTPGAAQRACRVLGSSRMLGDALRHQPEFVQTLGDDDALTTPKPRERFVDEAVAAVEWRATDANARRSGLRRYKRRELLRIAARDLLSFADLVETGRDLSTLAEACLEASIVALAPQVPFAVISMGRFGGCDLSYASDLDVLFVYDGDGAADFHEAERVATQLLLEIGERTAEGRTFAIDATLRPEGRQGSLTRSLAGFHNYWERYGLTWEFQALIKARHAAGDPELGQRFCELAKPFVYRDPFADESVQEVRRMKVRIEQERIPPGEDPQFHLKLGRGSLSDIEFTVQLAQLEHGAHHPSVRTPETMIALDALVAVDLLEPDDADALRESFAFCSAARNARFLVTGSERESLPTDLAEAERVARLLGYFDRPQATLREDYRRLTRHARMVVDRAFYGRE